MPTTAPTPPAPRPRRAWWQTLLVLVGVTVAVLVVQPGVLRLDDPPALSDHPYQQLRMASFHERLVAGADPLGWSQDFQGGYPELATYPPGHAAAGTVLAGGLGLDDRRAYALLVALAYVLPGVAAAWSLLVLGSRLRTAAVVGVVAGTVPFGFAGSVSGVAMGTLGARLGFALVPVVLAGVVRAAAADGRRARAGWLILLAAAVALAALAHPYVLPTLVTVVAVAAGLARRDRRPGTVPALLAAGAGLALAGTWYVGAALASALAVPFQASSPLTVWSAVHLNFTNTDWLWWLAVAGAVVSFVLGRRRRFGGAYALALAAPAVAVVLVGYRVVVDALLGIAWLDPTRAFDGVLVLVVIASLLWLEEDALDRVAVPVRIGAAAVALVVWIPVVWSSFPPSSLDLRLSAASGGDVARVWEELRAGKGRVLFTASQVHGTTHLFGRTPVEAGRESFGGASTTASPIQAALLYGPGAREVTDFADAHDNRDLFGITWAEVRDDPAAAERLGALLRRLGITEVVAERGARGMPDTPLEAFARRPELFTDRRELGPFTIVRVAGTDPAVVVADDPDVDVRAVEERPDRITATVAGDAEGAVVVRRWAGPYWEVSLDGAAVAPAQDELGQLRITVPAGEHRIEARLVDPPRLAAARVAAVVAGLALLALALAGVGAEAFRRTGRSRPRTPA